MNKLNKAINIASLTLYSLTFYAGQNIAADYPPNIDYGNLGDFMVKRGTEHGRTADLTPIGPILINFPEGPGSSSVAIDELVYRDTAWDLSDLHDPKLIRILYNGAQQPIGAHATVTRFDPELGAMLWNGGDYFRYDPNGETSIDQIIFQEFFDWDFEPHSYSRMFVPYHTRTYWEYGFDSSGLYAIRDTNQTLSDTDDTAWLGRTENTPWLGKPLVAWDHLGLTGVTGFTSWLGNLLIVASDQQSTGIAIYDTEGFKEGRIPRLLSVYNPRRPEPSGHIVGIGGYWVEPYGTNKMVFAARQRDGTSPTRDFPAMYVVDFTNPSEPYLSCEIFFNQDHSTGRDGDGSSDPMYVNFQDEYAYVDHFKVNIPACEAAFDDEVISASEFEQIVFKFEDLANHCDSSQYFRPLGQVGIFGGYDFGVTEDINEQGMCFFVTSNEADTRPPFISGHRPLANQSNYPTDGYIHLHIPETLRSETVVNAITLTNLTSNNHVAFKHQLSHTGTLAVLPDQHLSANSEFRVSVSGIQDFMGNTMEDYSFTFSTDDGDRSGENGSTGQPTEPAPTYSGTPYFPIQSSQLSCQSETENGNVWAVNPDNDSVTIIAQNFDSNNLTKAPSLIREVKLNYQKPTSVTAVNDMLVVTHQDDDKVVFYNQQGFPIYSLDTGHGSQPIASLSDNEFVYVALYGSGEVIKINLARREISSRLKVGPYPKAMALHQQRLLVTRFISPQNHGEVYDINTNDEMSLSGIIQINKVEVADDIDHGSGVPNYLSSIVITRAGGAAYISASKANTDRGLTKNGQALDSDNTVRPMIAALDLVNNRDANQEPNTRDNTIDLDNGADPSAITFLVNPAVRMHAMQGNNIVVAQNYSSNTVAQFNTGFAPQGMCTTKRTLYVKNFSERSVSAIDIAEYLHSGRLNPNIQTISTVTQEKLSDSELKGLQIFYHSSIPEMGEEGYMSCASCHAGGGHDGRTWDLSNMGEGLRNTLSLNGASGTRFGNLHWSSNFDEVQDFEIQMEQLNGGTGLIEGETFANGLSPLAHTSSNQSEDLDALASYINGLGKDTVKRSPYKTYTGVLSQAAQRGKQVFQDKNCQSCHSGTAFRDGQNHDVGTIKENSGQRLGGSLNAIRTPSLIELWDSFPYFHDGSAANLNEVLNNGQHQSNYTATEQADLIEYLLSIDREEYIDDE